MRREAAEHGWPVAGPSAYPWIQHRDPDGTMRPLEERDVRVVAACASGVTAFFSKHRGHFEQVSVDPVSERFVDPRGIEVRLAMSYETADSPDSGTKTFRCSAAATRCPCRREKPPTW